MSLSNVKHQSRAQDMLQRAYAKDRLPHAYIFHGPDGVGKETLARGISQLLLCDSPIESENENSDDKTAPPVHSGCGNCESCRLVLAETHPDIHSVYRQLARQHPKPEVRKRTARDIGVDVIRHFLVDKVHLTPSRGKAKIFLVREADRITRQAQNALLKTLEEPPGTTYIILLTASIDRLLPTTQSRCQLVEFNALPTPFVREKLGTLYQQLTPQDLDWYAKNASGSIGGAIEAIQRDRLPIAERVIDTLSNLSERKLAALVKEWLNTSESATGTLRKEDPDITDAEAKRIGLKIIFRIAAAYYADALRIKTGQSDDLINTAHQAKLHTLANALNHDEIIDRINRIARAENQLDRNIHAQLCVETLLGDLTCGVPA